MTTDPTALGALRSRAQLLTARIRGNVSERDRMQVRADHYQKLVDTDAAELNSINAAIELLEAATEYTAKDRRKHETTMDTRCLGSDRMHAC